MTLAELITRTIERRAAERLLFEERQDTPVPFPERRRGTRRAAAGRPR